MSRLQVLVATMNQSDHSIAEKMNIRCDAVIANQADREEISSFDGKYGRVKMITTATRGVGLNRNIALMAADSEYILFADDDVVYNDGMPEAVISAFNENPDADMLIFSMDILKNGQITERRYLKKKRLHVRNSMRFGTYTIAVRRDAITKNNITFHQDFGGGCKFSSGEDSLFIKACFDSGLKVYSHDYVLGTCCKDSSTWFVGCDEKYFYDKGVLMGKLFPYVSWVMTMYFAIRFKRETKLSVFGRIRYMYSGLRNSKKMCSYSERYEKITDRK